MEILVIALTLGLCFGADKLFAKLFRSAPEHQSGKAVRLQKMYGVFGIALIVIGIMAVISGVMNSPGLAIGGAVVIAMGIGLVVYFLSFGIFYSEDTFLLSTFARKSNTYRYGDIQGQKLYLIQGGSVVIELHMTDGRSVQLQSAMDGAYAFLDHAYVAWLRQTGTDPKSCAFHDPSVSCWFPKVDEET